MVCVDHPTCAGGEAPDWSKLPSRYVANATDEVRVVDPTTGGAKGQKLAQLGAIDPLALIELAKVAGYGTQKYDRMNFMKGYTWALSTDALFRHFLAFLNGEQNDPESGLPHMAHAAWHALALTTFSTRGLGTDDRYKGPASTFGFEEVPKVGGTE